MLNFVKSDPSLLQALQSGQEPNAAQLSKLTNFMIDDKFFQNQLLEGVTSTPENDWVKTISKNAQLRYLKIVTSVPQSLLDNPSTMNKIVNRLLKDKEIGPAMAKKYGSDVNNGQFLKNFKNELQSSVAAAKHHLFSMWSTYLLSFLIKAKAYRNRT